MQPKMYDHKDYMLNVTAFVPWCDMNTAIFFSICPLRWQAFGPALIMMEQIESLLTLDMFWPLIKYL